MSSQCQLDCKLRLVQSIDLATSTGANLPRRSVSAVVDNPSEAGIPSWLLANGSSEVSDFYL